MKPNFAINVTDEALGLLHRTSRGWMPVGEAAFDSPDLGEAISYLRSSALGLSPQGITTKIILPASQVLYLEVDAPGPDKASRLAQIKAALEGRTPYDVDDLVFDWWGKGPAIKLAVVARETLDEAEAFAVEHRLNPVSFVTVPGPDQFGAEPWFGATKLSESLLPKGEKVTRDQDPVVILQRDVSQPETAAVKDVAVPDKAATEDEDAKADASPDADTPAETGATMGAKAEAKAMDETADAKGDAKAEDVKFEADEQPESGAKKTAEDQEADAKKAETEKADKKKAEDDKAAAEKLEAEKAKADAKARELAEAEAARLAAEAAKRNKAIADDTERVRAQAERVKTALISAEADRARQVETSSKSTPARVEASEADAKAGAEKALVAFASRRREPLPDTAPRVTLVGNDGSDAAQPLPGARTGPTHPPSLTAGKILVTANSVPVEMPDVVPPKTASAPTPGAPPEPSAAAAPIERPDAGDAGAALAAIKPISAGERSPVTAKTLPASGKAGALITADRIPGKAQSKAKGRIERPAKSPSTTGADPSIGTFGAKLQPQRGKPRFLGLMLTMALLVFLALVAAWSSIYLSKNDAGEGDVRVVEGSTAPDTAPAEVAAINEPEAIADLDPEALADLQEEPNPEEIALADTPVATAPPVEAVVPEAQPEPELAAVAPEVALPEGAVRGAAPSAENLDEIFLTTMDGSPPAFDAVALPQPVTQPDVPPQATMPPPPFGTTYVFDPDGRIRATARGVVTPDGIWLIAARPTPEPPPRPAAISLPEPSAEATTPPDPAALPAPDATASEVLASENTSAFTPDATVIDNRPRARPADAVAPPPAQADDDAALSADNTTRVTSLRPKLRPQSVLARGDEARTAAAAASLAAAATTTAAPEGAGPLVALSPRPAARPKDFSRAVAAAVAEATRAPTSRQPSNEPEEQDEPEVVARASAAPRIPSSASVAKQATFKNAINLSKINLIGVYGTSNNRYALVRSSSGRYTKVKVGDRVDGGTVAAITTNELRYKKGSKMLALTMPKG